AVAASLEAIRGLASTGVPVVLLPLCNPRAYQRNWRYPNTPERDWQKGGGYSVGDSEYRLPYFAYEIPNFAYEMRPRAPAPVGPEPSAPTTSVLRLARDYPPRLVIDLHEDELSTGGYIYVQGARAKDSRVARAIVRILRDSGIPLRLEGKTRFGEPIVDGVVSQDEKGQPIRDG